MAPALPDALARRPAVAAALADLGRPGSRRRLPTPALIIDLDALERNLARMADFARDAGLALRPHAKSHKSVHLARLQLAAGATGVCCAKLGEAEALAAGGIEGLLVTSPVAGALAAARAAALAARSPGFMIVADHPHGVEELAAAAAARGGVLPVLVDVDVGLGRTGVADPAAAAALADAVARSPSLRLAGVQGYGGHWQHLPGVDARRAAVAEGMGRLTEAVEAIRARGHAVDVVTGGGTGTVAADAELGVLSEVQPGSYLFMDRQYRDALGADDGGFQTSLFVQAQVISANQPAFVTLDAGLKAFAADAGPPRPASGPFAACRYGWFGDEHGRLTRAAGADLALGARVELETPHCDPTVDKHDLYYLVRGDTLVDIQVIDARGQSQ